jgi:lipopolysaccharide biosynthesis regulator YciM
MDFDFTWLLWALPLTFGLGWLASRWDMRQMRVQSREAPKAYFRGLNHLLNEQQDQAIDAFIEAVQGDPDTAELHFALGNLFRRRGDYDRAVRVHEHLLARADLSRKDRDRAQHAIAQDFLKAGLLDRAEAALHKLQGTAHENEALLSLLAIYERSRDWSQAQGIAQRLDNTRQGSFRNRLAHYRCELAELDLRQGQVASARVHLEAATQEAPQLARAWIALSALQAQQDEGPAAFESLCQLAEQAPQALPLVAQSLADLGRQTGQAERAQTLLLKSWSTGPTLDVTTALSSLADGPVLARQRVLDHLNQEPSLVMAARWLADETLSQTEAQAPVQKALDVATGPLKRYRCAACGFEARQHFWQCPGCQSWDSYPARRVEEL